MAPISDDAFKFLQLFLERESGIVIGENKRYLLEIRLMSLLREEGLEDFNALVSAMRGTQAPRYGLRIVESMTTHETLWFRDAFPFDHFRDAMLKPAADRPGAGLRVWCAACATGQEPYSLSMLVEEMALQRPGHAPSVKIMATDISEAALRIAREGRYDALTLRRGMDDQRLQRFFDRREDDWKIRSEIASRISFRPANLLTSFSLFGQFDAIFCRNVLIYFSSDKKLDILDRLIQALRPGGTLFLGASEAIPESLVNEYRLVRQACGGGIYLKPSD
ncbi:MAG: protein-glutamate O-methyltransferase CheR [Halothiobacillaceae bacterium]|jgi:chemotaxis protein methyltransferase CheR|nr:MAG: protein-glutamate O-methyltransferase CheR [Halothiobacillaceae bacterium]